ncbi:MAG TPA: hypothetical protein VIK80_01060 [Flavihumibacter sp.]
MKSAANLLGLHIQGASPGQAFLMEKGERGTGRQRKQGKQGEQGRQEEQADEGNWGEHLHSVPVFIKYFNRFFGSDSTKKGAVNTAPLY